MTDAMPDFDNMTPEQINEWMESLARRQGATEGFTTSANMAVPEIDPTSVDQSLLEDTYVPFGWKREDWLAHLEKEAQQKADRQPTAPPPAAATAPVPAAQPAAQAQGGIQMSEQELTDFIMSLELNDQLVLLEEMGKSQRGEPNRLAELLPSWDSASVDESKLSKYTPGYMSEKEWEEYQAKEAAAKQPAPVSEPIANLGDVLKAPSMDDLFSMPSADEEAADDAVASLSSFLTGEETTEEPSAMLESLFAGQTSYADNDLPDDTASQAALDDPLNWLSQLGGAAPELDLPSVSFEDLNRGLADIPQARIDEDPLTWLAGLQELEPATSEPIDDLDTGMFNLGNLTQIAESTHADMISDDDDMNWLESIARASGADINELATEADTVLPSVTAQSIDGPGYQPYSFENAYTDDDSPNRLEDDLFHEMSVPDVSTFDDPETWLDALATNVNAVAHESAVAINEPDDTLEDEEEALDDPMEVMRALNAGAEVSPQVMENFFEKMFERAESVPDEPEPYTADAMPIEAEIPDWLQESFASVDTDTASEIPVSQMLQDLGLTEEEFAETSPLVDIQFSAPSSLDWQLDASDDPDPAEIGLADLVGLDLDLSDAEPVASAIPDWLLEQAGDISDDMSDIFADENTVPIELSQIAPDIEVDTSDPWVRAFAEESAHPDTLEEWYSQAVAQVEGHAPASPTPAVIPAASVPDAVTMPAASYGELQPAHLPGETVLAQAMPTQLPDWMLAEQPMTEAPSTAISEEWFDTSEETIPDWLRSQVTEELATTDALPSWLAGADIGDADVPDWLLETVEDHQLPPAPAALPTPAPAVAAPPAAVVIDRAPVPVVGPPPAARPAAAAPAAAAPAEVAARLQQAREALSTDVETSLFHYEAVVRSNAALTDVVQDLNRVVADKSTKSNPAVYRVLGDALMRQGKLSDALTTYRKALNLL